MHPKKRIKYHQSAVLKYHLMYVIQNTAKVSPCVSEYFAETKQRCCYNLERSASFRQATQACSQCLLPTPRSQPPYQINSRVFYQRQDKTHLISTSNSLSVHSQQVEPFRFIPGGLCNSRSADTLPHARTLMSIHPPPLPAFITQPWVNLCTCRCQSFCSVWKAISTNAAGIMAG